MMGFKETEIGSLPRDWDLSNLGHYFGIKQGKQVSAKTRQGNNIKHFLRTANVFWGKIDLTKLDKMHFSNNETEELTLQENDLLVCEGGEIGRTAIWRNSIIDCYYQNHLHRLRAKDTSVFPEFYMYWLWYGFLVGKHYIGIGNKTTISNLSQSRLKLFLVPHPSISEQQNIAYTLSLIQSAIEVQERIIKTTTELKNALMHKLFTEGLRGEKQKRTEIGLIPKSWGIVPLKQTGEVVYGIQAAVANLTKPVGVKILTNINITFDGKIDLTHLRYFPLTKPRHFKTLLQKGDILFNWRSGSKDHVGKTAFFDLDGEFTHASFILRIRTNAKIFNQYLFYYLTYLRMFGYFCNLQNYAVNAKFNASAVNALPTVVPVYEEQLEIAKVLSTLDIKIENQNSKLNILQELFTVMLKQLMTGRTSVKDIKIA